MKICGIICELNPAHNGHEYLISKVKKELNCDYVFAIMSGNFVQRGEPAIFDYRTRAKMAINIGFDAVFYLPTIYTMNSADDFAKFGVKIANFLNIDYLAFGSLLDIETLNHITASLEVQEFSQLLKDNLSSGVSYAKAFGDAVKTICNIELTANDILALQYMNALKNTKSNITPVTYKRLKDVSATNLRQLILNKNYDEISKLVNHKNYEIILNTSPFDYPTFRHFEFYNIINKSAKELQKIKSMSEGIENKIYNSKFHDLDELNVILKSKRYSQTYLNRLYFNIAFSITNIDQELPYLKVVAVKDETTLKHIESKISLITNLKNKSLLNNESIYSLDTICDRVYNTIAKIDDFNFPFHKIIIHQI